MSKYSKILKNIAATDNRVEEYEYDPGNDYGAHWLHLKWPWTDGDACGCIHEYTVADCLRELREVSV